MLSNETREKRRIAFGKRFVDKAHKIHGDRYDYSKVHYVDARTKVEIVCPVHGSVWVAPERHFESTGCYQCNDKNRCVKLAEMQEKGEGPWGAKSRVKARETIMDRYGAKTWAESDEGRRIAREMCAPVEVRELMSQRAKTEEARRHYKETSLRNWGADHWIRSAEGSEIHRALCNTPEERLARSRRMLSSEVRRKIEATSMERYGTPYYWQCDEGRERLQKLLTSEEVVEKTKRTCLERYGAESWSSSDVGRETLASILSDPIVRQKCIDTKKRNGTINDSQPERDLYALLCDKFGEDDVDVQYWSKRYPYKCDFYIKSLDCFIELNAYWMHGNHWFDINNDADLEKLQLWLNKVDEGKESYERAIYVWSENDPEKLRTAIKNNLNYVVFWDTDLTDAKQWLVDGCPLKQY